MKEKMLKTLIIDDDLMDFTYLKNLINWEKEGFILYEKPTSGINAIETIEKQEPEIIITDMNMPGVDGVEVIRYLYNNYPHIKIIVLSAYDDFKYVKQSFKMGALDYLLKHNLSADSLLKLLKAIRYSIVEEQEEDVEKEMVAEQLKTGRNILVQNFINKLLMEEKHNHRELKERMDSLNLKLESRNLVIVLGEFDDFDLIKERYLSSEINSRLNSFYDMANEILEDMGEAVLSMMDGGRFVILFPFDNYSGELEIYNRVSASIRRLKSTIKRYLNLTACFAIGEVCNSLDNIHRCYIRTEKLLDKKFYEGKDRIFHSVERKKTGDRGSARLSAADEKKIIELAETLKEEELLNFIKGLLFKVKLKEPSIGSAKFIFFSLLNIITMIAREHDISYDKIFGEVENPYEELNRFDTIEEVMEWIFKIYEELIYYLNIFKINPETEPITGKAIKYIYKHYRGDISLKGVAEHVGVNSSYLSRKFKIECGQSYSEYLKQLRIEQAKILMENSNKKIKEIAAEVGFNNYNYFFKVFKDIQGMTPLEYQKGK